MNQMTEHVLRKNFVTLLYIEDPRTFDAKQGLDGHLAGPYRICLQMPIAEFMTRTPMGMVVELVKHTASAEWRETRQRSVQPGDMICVGLQPWLAIAADDVRYYPINLVQRTDAWTDGAIVMLSQESVRSMRDRPKNTGSGWNEDIFQNV